MPVTARLSKKFYDAWGEELAQDLVDWFNQVDATYRTDLKELNELNFARFDAKLEQRIAELDAKLEQRISQLDAKIDKRIAELRGELTAEIVALRAELKSEIAGVRAEIRGLEQRLDGRLESSLASMKADLIKWMFLFWAGTALTVIGLATTLLR